MAIERIVPDTLEWKNFYGNHIVRYIFAKDQLKKANENKLEILDAACGVGYGSKFLAQNLNCNVTAIDKSFYALNIAKKFFDDSSIRFLEDDCATLKVAKEYGAFDAVISFETLEHLTQPINFLNSCYMNIKEGGRLIISTPNKLVSSPNGEVLSKFHEREYFPQEFAEILSGVGFSEVKIYGQQLNSFGLLRSQIRSELSVLRSSPFVRFGVFIQKSLRGYKEDAILPEQPEDFDISFYPSLLDLIKLSKNGPFVLIAVCVK